MVDLNGIEITIEMYNDISDIMGEKEFLDFMYSEKHKMKFKPQKSCKVLENKSREYEIKKLDGKIEIKFVRDI